MKSIPRFMFKEAEDIRRNFIDAGIPYKTTAVNMYASPWGAASEYTFWVKNEDYDISIDLIRRYLGITQRLDDELYTGKCPACSYEVINQKVCPSCTLSLSNELTEKMKEHPFYIYLKQQNLL